jgi:hypothetical protein
MVIPFAADTQARDLAPSARRLTIAAMCFTFMAIGTDSLVGQGAADAEIADGQPWRMETDGGRKMTLVLFPDGTSQLSGGAVNSSPRWRPIEGGICLKPAALMREKCVSLRPISNGFVATWNDATIFTLRR